MEAEGPGLLGVRPGPGVVHEAVAQPVARPLGPIQQGDRVASKILGS